MTPSAETVTDPNAALPIPGDSGWPILGWTLQAFKDPLKFLQWRYEKFGVIFWSKVFGIKLFQLLGPDANEFVLLNRDSVFSNAQGWDFFIGKFFTRGIMLLDFKEHQHHRRIMQEAFKKPVLEAYLARMNPGIDRAINAWSAIKMDSSAEPNFLVFPALKQLTLDLATDIFMGCELGAEANRLNKAFFDCVRGGTAIVRYPVPFLNWHKGLQGRKVLVKFFQGKIAAQRRSQSHDMFSVLCNAENEDGQKFSDEDVINHMIFLMMAAHDTTTITLTSMFYQLAKNPQWQERVRQESVALNKPALNYEDLEKLHGLTLVMKESLRLCTPVPMLPRVTTKDCEYKGFHIPKGSMINISIHFTHMMKEYWPNPDQFDPERFSDQRREDKVHSYAWLPFGGGVHKCIGLHFADLQVKAIMHQILLNYRWSVDKDYQIPMDYTSLPVPYDRLPVSIEAIS